MMMGGSSVVGAYWIRLLCYDDSRVGSLLRGRSGRRRRGMVGSRRAFRLIATGVGSASQGWWPLRRPWRVAAV